jgi:replication factor A3
MVARVNSRLLEQYKGQTVRLTAKIIKLSGETATVEATDGGQVSFVIVGLYL